MQVKTRVKAGGITLNHNETLVRAQGQSRGLTVKTRVKAGGITLNHNETLVRATPRQRARV
jgi:large exoprotein involved in heme utilization and adhesion